VWNADELDAGILLITWGIALMWPSDYYSISTYLYIIGVSAIIIGLLKAILSTTRLGKRPVLSIVRVGLPIPAMMIWLGATLTAIGDALQLQGDNHYGGWAAVLYFWLAYRAAKSFYRLITQYVAQKLLDSTLESTSESTLKSALDDTVDINNV
jgi:hypothetical protein